MAAYASVNQIETYLREEKSVPAAADNGGEERRKGPQDEDIHLESASFSWAPDVPPFLGPLFAKLTPGQLHIVGLVASKRATLGSGPLGP
ncbi:hypothetical protein B0H14DRAFT_3453308 [Mycena olivaceomarginata]|nr:hypothetical protein B0H14DRAFT_3453308 [Mycena olivaceomarginata]